MIRAVLLFAALCGAPAWGAVVRSGEHGAFTRLAFAGNGTLDWSVQVDGPTATISFSPAPEFDISLAFERIDRERLAALAARDGILELTMACQCGVTVERVEQDYIVIDIAPRPASLAAAEPVRPSPTPVPDISGTIPLVLPAAEMPLGARIARAAREDLAGPRRPTFAPVSEAPPPPAQIQFRDGRAADIRVASEAPQSEIEDRTCDGASRIEQIMMGHGPDARDALSAHLLAYDPTQPESVAALRDAYYAAGLYREAGHLALAAGAHDRWSRLLLLASGEASPTARARATLICGPATTLASLGAAPPTRRPDADDRAELRSLLLALPSEAAATFVPRAAANARVAGFTALASELEAAMPSADAPTPTFDPVAHGAALADRLLPVRPPGNLDADDLADADAVLGELPNGPVADTLRVALLRNAAWQADLSELRRRMAAADDSARAAALEAIATDLLRSESSRALIVATTLLQWKPQAAPAVQRRLADLLQRGGYPSVAERWQRPGAVTPTVIEAPLADASPEDIAWISRDMRAVAGGETARARLAEHLLSGDPVQAPGTLPAARERLERSRATASRVAALLAAEAGDGTVP